MGLQREMTNVLVPQLESITPGSGCYLNEVNLPLLVSRRLGFAIRDVGWRDVDWVIREIHTSRIGKRLSMASITRVCARSRPSMTLMISSMLPRLLGVMSGKLRVRGGCVRCRLDGVREKRLGRWR